MIADCPKKFRVSSEIVGEWSKSRYGNILYNSKEQLNPESTSYDKVTFATLHAEAQILVTEFKTYSQHRPSYPRLDQKTSKLLFVSFGGVLL